MLFGLAGPGHATPIDQVASSVIAFSSEFDTPRWAAAQALGAPDTFAYGDFDTSWAASTPNSSLETITLGYDTPVFATGATVRETWGNGFVFKIDVLDLSDVLHNVWTGTDPSLPGTPVDFVTSWTQTSFLVKGLKIYVDPLLDTDWEEIDSVLLSGDTVAIPEPSTALLLGFGLAALAAKRSCPTR
ncbi:MAG: PEP-CTERM sorting domain-containing protein [Proteobacteria bacterium]|nr:PEP-CTERM sorting domain-containing protein [Pseudomonadota bacterium]